MDLKHEGCRTQQIVVDIAPGTGRYQTWLVGKKSIVIKMVLLSVLNNYIIKDVD